MAKYINLCLKSWKNILSQMELMQYGSHVQNRTVMKFNCVQDKMQMAKL